MPGPITGGPGGDGTSFTTPNVAYVQTNGNDGTGALSDPSKPFLTIEAAQAAASSGDAVRVGPGTYVLTGSMSKSGVHFRVDDSVTIIPADDVQPFAGGSFFTGDSEMVASNSFLTSGLIVTGGVDAPVLITARRMYVPIGSAGGTANTILYQSGGGPVDVTADDLEVDGVVGLAIWWSGPGNQFVRCRRLSGPVAFSSGGTSGSNAYLEASDITGTVNSGISGPGDATAALWLRTATLRPLATTTEPSETGLYANRAVDWLRLNKLYINTQKIWGEVYCNSAALVYLYTSKWEAVANAATYGLFLSTGTTDVSAGTTFIEATHLDPKSFSGYAFWIHQGEVTLKGLKLVGSSVMNGLFMDGGTVTLINCRIDTTANSGTDALLVNGGTLNLISCVIISEGSKYDINNTGGTVNVSGGNGSGTSGHFTTNGSVNFLTPV